MTNGSESAACWVWVFEGTVEDAASMMVGNTGRLSLPERWVGGYGGRSFVGFGGKRVACSTAVQREDVGTRRRTVDDRGGRNGEDGYSISALSGVYELPRQACGRGSCAAAVGGGQKWGASQMKTSRRAATAPSSSPRSASLFLTRCHGVPPPTVPLSGPPSSLVRLVPAPSLFHPLTRPAQRPPPATAPHPPISSTIRVCLALDLCKRDARGLLHRQSMIALIVR
ncbi:hypothetical protein C8Q77DRAFT_88497 [Trametes polyzona]|nr:hypothetical protein C8Q77DRAFT_88497 [Trametes polyzona]